MKMKTLSICCVVLPFFAAGYQSANSSNCDLRDAYSKSIDWLASSKFDATSTYDGNIASLQAGTYTLSSNLITGRLFIDGSTPRNTVFDFGTSTLSLLGYKRSPLHALNFSSSGSTFRLASGTILLPETHPDLPANGWYMGPYPVLALPRVQDSKSRNMMFVVGGGVRTALLDVGEIHCQYGTNNWLVVTNGGIVAVGGVGTKIGESTGNDANDDCAARAVLNGIRVIDGGVYSNKNEGVSQTFTLFGLSQSMSNTFEVVDGGQLVGWDCFRLNASSGNVLAFRGTATRQVFKAESGWHVSYINGIGTRLEIIDGAHLELLSGASASNGRIFVGGASSSSSNTIVVSGLGSYLFCQSVGTYIGENNSSYNRLEVSDGGRVKTSLVRLGQAGTLSEPSNFNCLRVTSGGLFEDTVGLVVGQGAYCSSNRLEISDSGAVTNYDLTVGNSETAVGNAIDILEGELSIGRNLALGAKGSWSQMDVRGGSVDVGGTFVCGTSEGGVSNNVVRIVQCGRLSVNQFDVYGQDHTFVLSNGMIEVSHGITLPSGDSVADVGMSLLLGGTNPVLRVEGGTSSIEIRSDTAVMFIVPSCGYVEPPLQAANGIVSIGGDGGECMPELRFVIPEDIRGTLRCVLAEGASIEIEDSVMDRARASLPSNCLLRVSADRRKLILTINPKGFCMRIR